MDKAIEPSDRIYLLSCAGIYCGYEHASNKMSSWFATAGYFQKELVLFRHHELGGVGENIFCAPQVESERSGASFLPLAIVR